MSQTSPSTIQGYCTSEKHCGVWGALSIVGLWGALKSIVGLWGLWKALQGSGKHSGTLGGSGSIVGNCRALWLWGLCKALWMHEDSVPYSTHSSSTVMILLHSSRKLASCRRTLLAVQCYWGQRSCWGSLSRRWPRRHNTRPTSTCPPPRLQTCWRHPECGPKCPGSPHRSWSRDLTIRPKVMRMGYVIFKV